MQTRAGTGPRRRTSVLHHLVKCASSGVLGECGAFCVTNKALLGPVLNRRRTGTLRYPASASHELGSSRTMR